MADLTHIEAAQLIKIIGSDSTGLEQTPVQSTDNGALHSNLRSSAGVELSGRNLPTVGVSVTITEAPTYAAGISTFVAAASPTDIFTITGSATKVIRIKKLYVGVSSTNPSTPNFVILKRSTANTGGTYGTPTSVPFDSIDQAATAVVRNYTANPTDLGTLVGIIKSIKPTVPQTTPLGGAANGPVNVIDFTSNGSKDLILRGTSQVLSLNMNGITLAGNIISTSIEWTEENT